MAKLTLEALVEKVDEIPVFSETVRRILAIIEDPNSSAKDVEREIKLDQGYTVQVLKLANSAYFGGRRNIKTVADATVLLGHQAIKSMVLASAVGGIMGRELKGYALERETLWRQSQACAITARVLAKKIHYRYPDQVYTAGLLHDIGKVVLDIYLKATYDEVLAKIDQDQISFIDIESEILGFHHGEVGARIAEKWQLPDVLIEAIAFHHTPEKAIIDPKMTAMTHIADGLVMMLGMYVGVDGLSYNFSEYAMNLLCLDDDLLTEVMSDVIDLLADEHTFITI